jgi:opacity protein-like surface antigen
MHGQARPTAYRSADLQVGAGVTGANPDYSPSRFYGYFIYGTLDLKTHYGVEAEFHQLNTAGNNNDWERTYQIGARYVRHYFNDTLHPFVKASIGRGTFNFPYNRATLSYGMYGFSAGADVRVSRSINVRGEYEYERWPNFPPRGLQPNVVSIGAAYHFH